MIGALVRYTGSSHPEMAGMEGRVHSVGTDASGNMVLSARWYGRYGHKTDWDSRPISKHEVKQIRSFSKRIIHPNGTMNSNGRASTVDPVAARELSLYIENDYELVGAPNSRGKAIHANLMRKVESGKYESSQAPQAWLYLVDDGAKKYTQEFGSDSPIFNQATRREVAKLFAEAWEQENGVSKTTREADRYEPPRVQLTTEQQNDRDYAEAVAALESGKRDDLVMAYQVILGALDLRARGATERKFRIMLRELQEALDEIDGHRRNGRRVPEYLQGYEGFSTKDFENDLRDRGYSAGQARYHAVRSAQATGRTEYLPPRVPAGWRLFGQPIFHELTLKPAFVGTKGAKYQVFDHAGKSLSGELRNMRAYHEWRGEHGYGQPGW